MISVVVLTYNGEKYITKCIDCLIYQTIDINDFEIVIIDDASTDKTLNIIDEYRSIYPRNIKVWANKINSNINNNEICNRDIGVRISRGDYIVFLDQDDWFELNALEILSSYIKNYPDLDYIEFSYYNTSENNITTISSVKQKGFNVYEIMKENDRSTLTINRILPGYATVWNKLYNKQFLLDNNIVHNGGLKKSGFSDNFFSGLIVLYTKQFATLDKPLYNYFHHTSNGSKGESFQYERCKVGLFYFEECIERKLYNKNKEMVEYMFYKMFLLKTFWKFILQFRNIPYDKLSFIQKKIREIIPNYRENSILKLHPEMEALFEILDHEWTKEYIDEIKIKILKNMNNKDLYKDLYLTVK